MSAVVEIDEENSEEASRISNSLMAMLNGKGESWGKTRFDFFYYPEVRKAKHVIHGSVKFITAILAFLLSACVAVSGVIVSGHGPPHAEERL